MSDILAVFSWWLAIQGLGFAAWPLAARWLRWLPDRGYMLAKPIGLLFVSYGLWLLATIGVIQNSTGGIIAVLIGFAAISAWIYRRLQPPTSNLQPPTSNFQLLTWLRSHLTLVIAYEVVFAVALIGWALFRANNPDLGSTEKPMEFAFFNAIGRSAQFPPHDPWLSGYAIAYYYFGYVMMSLLHKLTGVTAGIAFSLSNAFWFALSAASAFGMVANLVLLAAHGKHPERTLSEQSESKRQSKDAQSSTPLRSAQAQRAAVMFGTLAAVMLVLMGNFEASLEVARVSDVASPQFFAQLDVLDVNQPYVAPEPGQPRWPPRFWWWWRASRVIHDYPPNTVSPQVARVTGLPPAPNTTFQETIDEFPQFSFLLGDLHPHVLALPFALLMMALALNLYAGSAQGDIGSLWSGANRAPLWPLYALAVGGLSFLNTWDFPIYAVVLASALTLGRRHAGGFNLLDSITEFLILAATGFVFYVPFYRAFTSQAAGIAPNLFNGTRAGQFFVMFGPFIVIGLMFGALVLTRLARARQIKPLSFAATSIGGGIGLIAAMSLMMLALTLIITRVSERANTLITDVGKSLAAAGLSVSDHVAARLADPWVPLALSAGLVAILLIWRTSRSTNYQLTEQPITINFALLLYAVGLLLTFGVEFAFIIDGFGTRMNTVFKFYYQAWALWTAASAFAAYYLVSQLKAMTRIAAGAAIVLVVATGLLYPLLAVPDKVEKVTPTLDALEFSGQFAPDEYAAAQWFNQTVGGTPVIVEAPGDEYNPSTSRMSTWTGLPSVVGWAGHEQQWRGSYEIQGPRVDAVNEIYSTTDMNRALELLNSYHAAYVVVGPNEQRLYSATALAKFQTLPIAYQPGAVTIYRVP